MMLINKENILKYAKKYEEGFAGSNDELAEKELKKWLKIHRYLDKKHFLELCMWKSRRPKKHYHNNNELKIIKTTKEALSAKDDKCQIEKLLILKGVGYPVASVILHFAFPEKYSIIDFRAIWSLGWGTPPNYYKYDYWERYCTTLREIAKINNLPLRMVDKALWQYSKENQKK